MKYTSEKFLHLLFSSQSLIYYQKWRVLILFVMPILNKLHHMQLNYIHALMIKLIREYWRVMQYLSLTANVIIDLNNRSLVLLLQLFDVRQPATHLIFHYATRVEL